MVNSFTKVEALLSTGFGLQKNGLEISNLGENKINEQNKISSINLPTKKSPEKRSIL